MFVIESQIKSPNISKSDAATIIAGQKSYGYAQNYRYCFENPADSQETALVTLGDGGSLNPKLEFALC